METLDRRACGRVCHLASSNVLLDVGNIYSEPETCRLWTREFSFLHIHERPSSDTTYVSIIGRSKTSGIFEDGKGEPHLKNSLKIHWLAQNSSSERAPVRNLIKKALGVATSVELSPHV